MYAPRAFLQLGIAGHSWELSYAQPPAHKALSVLFPERFFPRLGGICIHRWRPGTLIPLCLIPSGSLFRAGPGIVAASHLNDKDAFVGRARWHRALLAVSPPHPLLPPGSLWWARGETEVPLCPHIREQRDRRNSSFL